ncbi:MAG TPA: HlyD family secretion protein [Vicinamibacterales bacterium]|jgi:membrane fusion protein (multidrug efflux system)|nr:HlyD family secretion protein [Vicinamibacterales bacterium]
MAEAKAETEKADAPAGNGRRWRIGGAVVAVLVIIGGIVWLRSRGHESTDDAQVDGRITQIAARVGGPVLKVAVENNQPVAAGALLVQIDPADYQVAVDRAKAELADAQANAGAARTGVPIARVETRAGVSNAAGTVEQAQAGVSGAEHEVQVAQANLVTAQAHEREKEATALKAAKDVDRLRPLVEKDEISRQQFDAAVASADAARAAADAAKSDVASAQSAITVAQQRVAQARGGAAQARAGLATAETAPQQLQVTQARAAAAEARVRQAEAALKQAELNLQYATITAPTAGVVSRKSVEPGQVLQPGQPVLALVDLDRVWVTANFKETQLKSMRPGQKAVVEVDALGGKSFEAHVDSIAAATGAKFSLLPPENATGNFVKVVQRVPVRIFFEPNQDPNHLLRPGMSVTPTVYVK